MVPHIRTREVPWQTGAMGGPPMDVVDPEKPGAAPATTTATGRGRDCQPLTRSSTASKNVPVRMRARIFGGMVEVLFGDWAWLTTGIGIVVLRTRKAWDARPHPDPRTRVSR